MANQSSQRYIFGWIRMLFKRKFWTPKARQGDDQWKPRSFKPRIYPLNLSFRFDVGFGHLLQFLFYEFYPWILFFSVKPQQIFLEAKCKVYFFSGKRIDATGFLLMYLESMASHFYKMSELKIWQKNFRKIWRNSKVDFFNLKNFSVRKNFDKETVNLVQV